METLHSIKTFILGLNPFYVRIAMFVVGALLLAAVGYITNYLVKTEIVKNKYNHAVDEGKKVMTANMHKSKFKAFDYDYIDMFIKKTGISYMFEKVNPLNYIGIKVLASLLLLIIGLQENIILGIVLMHIGYFGIDFIFSESNKSDNEKMLEDIKNIYDTLRIQTKAGVYITSVLTDCYLVVHNKRLKKALLELTSDIIAKNDMEEALDSFTSKFTNSYIDTLATIIRQSMQTGQAAKMFDDIRDQISDIEAALVISEKQRIDRQVIIVQLLLYASIIMTAVFVASTTLQEGLLF